MDHHPEMRRHPRQELLSAIMIAPDGHSAMALNVSAGGARVGLLDDWRPPRGSLLPVFFLSDSDRAIVLKCRVTRVAVDHLGIAFEPDQHDDIERLLDALGMVH